MAKSGLVNNTQSISYLCKILGANGTEDYKYLAVYQYLTDQRKNRAGLVQHAAVGRVQVMPGAVFQLDVQAGFFLELPILQVVVQAFSF